MNDKHRNRLGGSHRHGAIADVIRVHVIDAVVAMARESLFFTEE